MRFLLNLISDIMTVGLWIAGLSIYSRNLESTRSYTLLENVAMCPLLIFFILNSGYILYRLVSFLISGFCD